MDIKNQDTTDARISVLENNYHLVSHHVEKLEFKIDQNYATLHSRVSELRDDLRSDFEAKNEKILIKMEEHNKASCAQNKALTEKIAHIERWRWMIMGGALVVGYIIAHIKLETFI
tara:strand:+ start:408 stop:755 length:348 start_codon:yes stop_codon:yes gene_type:complete